MASPEEYAAWIVQNQHKFGTPEFDTVARAYQMARANQTQPAQPRMPASEQIASDHITRGAKENASFIPSFMRPALEYVGQNGMMGGPMGMATDAAVRGTSELMDRAAYKGGEVATDIASYFGAPAEVAGGLGYATNVGIQAIPTFAGGNVGANIAQAKNARTAVTDSVRQATLKEGRDAGFVLPPSRVSSSWLDRRLESAAGKAALEQEAALRNSTKANDLARRAAGLEQNQPITQATLDASANRAAQPYRDVAALPAQPNPKTSFFYTDWQQAATASKPLMEPAKALHDLKAVRLRAKDHWREFDMTGSVRAKDAAQKFDAKATQLEQVIDDAAVAAGKPELVDALRTARTQIAKIHDVDRARNVGSGDIDPGVIGRMLDRGAPLTGELATIGRFQQAFPGAMREAPRIPTSGVSKSEALAAALLAQGGASAAQHPYGLFAGGLPLVSGPIRSMILSKPYQHLMMDPAGIRQRATILGGSLGGGLGAYSGQPE